MFQIALSKRNHCFLFFLRVTQMLFIFLFKYIYLQEFLLRKRILYNMVSHNYLKIIHLKVTLCLVINVLGKIYDSAVQMNTL